MSDKPTYFTCTLGQVESLGLRQPHETINELIDSKAVERRDRPAVGFPIPSTDAAWQAQVFTFADLLTGSKCLAQLLVEEHASLRVRRSTVALLCPSTPEFLFTWLALIRLGHAVLLVAPQCAPSAIAALCEQCDVELLFFDEAYAELAQQSGTKESARVQAVPLPFNSDLDLAQLLNTVPDTTDGHEVTSNDVAYLHHTSGTSTGVPKPIPQSHHAGVGVLPDLKESNPPATFTTTPLYHGGVADFFRAATSSAMIWLFPGKSVPITASNIIRCLDVARESTASSPVKYFSSVPYVLQMVGSDEEGLRHLKGMDLVGVGGAALPGDVGDRLVAQGVNLLSRFGSAECGFLLSSHRDYASDKAWQYLRCAPDQQYLRFEQQDSGLSELIILKGWPHMAKTNREDGSYATADLFEPHATIPGAWRYHSRADSQLTLITGKKFDPAPLEADIATSEHLTDAIIFGNGYPYPGVLLFRSQQARNMSDADLMNAVWPLVTKLNQGSQDHAKISQSMLIPMAVLSEPLEKSSKGTLLRGTAEARFEKDIRRAYDTGSDEQEVSDTDLATTISKIVTDSSHKELQLDDHTDLFSAGIDSVAGIQIRSRLRSLLPPEGRDLPMTLVEECGSIDGLVKYVKAKRAGSLNADAKQDDSAYMIELVEQYSKFVINPKAQEPSDGGEVVVLTGATGALGAHVLDQYQRSDKISKIYCLARGSDEHAAQERVKQALEKRRLAPLGPKIKVFSAQLGEADLGLQPAVYKLLSQEVTVIMHVAWSVNFRMRLRSFVKDNIAGVTNLLNLALASPRSRKPIFGFCSSVASVMSWPQDEVPESMAQDPGTASPLGYSQSKWVAEQICDRANRNTPLAGRVAIFRVGQLAGDTVHGVWNSSEAWPLMLSSSRVTHSLPRLQHEVLDWLPVDIAATALIQGVEYVGAGAGEASEVFHVVNDHTQPSWMEMISWLQKHESLEITSPAAWTQRLSELNDEGSSHPALKLLSHWESAYRDGDTTSSSHRKRFSTLASRFKIPALQQVKPVDEVYFDKLWQWIKHEM